MQHNLVLIFVVAKVFVIGISQEWLQILMIKFSTAKENESSENSTEITDFDLLK